VSESAIRHIVYAQAVRTALLEEMRRDPTVIVMGEDVGVYGGVFGVTKGLLHEFGEERVRDTPIAEAALVGMAAGAAMVGLRPVVELMYSDFTATAMDPIVNNVAKFHYMSGGQLHLPLVIRTPAGGGVGYAAQHSQSPEAWFAHVPGLKVVMPGMPADARGLLKSAIRDPNPVLFFEHKALYMRSGPVPAEETLVPIGEADVKREGSDVTVVAWSRMVWDALEAAEALESEGVSVEVVDPRTLQPLDLETIIASVRKTERLVVAHEATRFGGLGAEIAATICERCAGDLKSPPARVGGRFAPVAFSEPMESFVLPGKDDIVAAVRQMVAG
jgi:pyruvate/2-oxoglutarate/acetoin dehydrogenase E1 component